ncbi:hypothetical protein [Spiroplasma endosymbiont of Poecilobothrus nobilitatus]|uniref:hypothetical protein n=1 Tax=Spiroplasma endosymbiont of Poecilobothrus nobilitatus TaxID=1209220 RepID=UPI00313BC355
MEGEKKRSIFRECVGKLLWSFFIPSIEYIFDSKVNIIGDDANDKWSRTAKADIELNYNNELIILEIQTGFQGINDIKRHKILESKEQFLRN